MTQNQTTLIDEEERKRVLQYKWVAAKYWRSGYYAVAYVDGVVTKLHRFILRLSPSDPQVDHINGNTLDNRKANLRLVTQSQQNMNRRKGEGYTSKYKGVHRAAGKWRAGIKLDGKSIYLGRFVNEEDAARAYNEAALKYFGEFVVLNETGDIEDEPTNGSSE